MSGLLLVVSGPSATGKGTVCRQLVEETEVEISVSATTREPRPGEVHGEDYFFMSEEEFVRIIQEDGFLEHVENFGRRYGTLVGYVKEKIASGKDMILEIDVQGAAMIKKKFPECVLIFLLPPSLKDLRERIQKRGTETAEKMEQRLKKAIEEIECIVNYDYYIVNREIPQAVEDMKSIIHAEHQKVSGSISAYIIEKFKEEE